MKKLSKKVVGMIVTCLTMVSTGICAFASTTSESVSYSDLASVVDVLKNQINVTSIIGIIAGIGVVCVGLVFFWWGLRKVIKMVMSAFKKGRFTP